MPRPVDQEVELKKKGAPRVVSERLVTKRDEASEQVITIQEKVVESRVRAKVIRRRTTRTEMLREPATENKSDETKR